MKSTDAGRRWVSTDKFESYVRDCLTRYEEFFANFSGDFLPLMEVTIPGQFNKSGHGIDIIALDGHRRLWIIEVSRGSSRGAASFKDLLKRKSGSQMSPSWRVSRKDEFLKLPDSLEKLSVLFDIQGWDADTAKKHFDRALEDHRVAIIVPEGCHVQGNETSLMFGNDIYTLHQSSGVTFKTKRR